MAERTKELTAETEARKSMMLNIFHDLRSPLFAVSGGLETLGSAPEALPALLPALRQRIDFLRRLTEDLFLAAKLEQKQILLNEDRAALNEEAAAVCAACRMPSGWHIMLRRKSVPGTRCRLQVGIRPARLSDRMANSTPLVRSRWQA